MLTTLIRRRIEKSSAQQKVVEGVEGSGAEMAWWTVSGPGMAYHIIGGRQDRQEECKMWTDMIGMDSMYDKVSFFFFIVIIILLWISCLFFVMMAKNWTG